MICRSAETQDRATVTFETIREGEQRGYRIFGIGDISYFWKTLQNQRPQSLVSQTGDDVNRRQDAKYYTRTHEYLQRQ